MLSTCCAAEAIFFFFFATPEEGTEAVSYGEAGAAIAARREAAGCREAAGPEGEALTGVGGRGRPF